MASYVMIVNFFIVIEFFNKSEGAVLTTRWNKSPLSGTHLSNVILHSVVVRSTTECIGRCSKFTGCLSVEFAISTKTCTLLSMHTQDAPFVQNADLVHYSKGCPTGYAILPQSITCVKHWPNEYLSWNDSKDACITDGADLPILDSDLVFNEFRDWMDVNANDRVAVNAKYVGQQFEWGNGMAVDIGKFCVGNPDLSGPDVCLYMEDKIETWCGSTTTRLDDGQCHTESLRICMIKL